MKRILVIGLSPILGGVETYIYNLIKFSNRNKYYYDFLIIGSEKSVFEDEINALFNDNRNHFYYCPNLKKNFLKGIKWLMDFYKENYYDVIYLNTCTCARIQYCLAGLKNGTKLITHSHNGDGDSKINNLLFRPLLSRLSNVKFSCSDLASKWLYGSAKSAIIVPNGVDIKRFAFNLKSRNKIRNDLNVTEKDILIGHVGRFSSQKNHAYFIEIAKRLNEKYKFLLLGDGELKEYFLELVKNNKLEQRFIVLPANNKIEDYYSAMDLFVMPSLYEGLPIVAVEAQTNGLTCIFSDNVSKNSDLSNHCYFIPLEDINKFKKTIENCNCEKFDGIKEIQSRKFDIESTVELFEKTVENLFSIK